MLFFLKKNKTRCFSRLFCLVTIFKLLPEVDCVFSNKQQKKNDINHSINNEVKWIGRIKL